MIGDALKEAGYIVSNKIVYEKDVCIGHITSAGKFRTQPFYEQRDTFDNLSGLVEDGAHDIIKSMADELGLEIGESSHTRGLQVSVKKPEKIRTAMAFYRTLSSKEDELRASVRSAVEGQLEAIKNNWASANIKKINELIKEQENKKE